MIINSPDFEPEKERNDIVLQLNEKVTDSDESLINKFIITKRIDLYEKIVQYAIDINCIDLFNLCSGLTSDSIPKYIKQNFTEKMREIASSFPIFETTSGLKNINEIIIPLIDDYKDFIITKHNEEYENIYKEFYRLLSSISYKSKHSVIYDHCIKMKNIIWPSFQSTVNINDFIEYISSFNKLSEMPITKSGPKELFLKDVFNFVEKMTNSDNILCQNKLLINENEILVTKDEIYHFNLPKELFDMLDIVNYDYHQEILHPKLSDIYNNENINFYQFGIKNAIQQIKDKIDNENSIQFMKFIIKNDPKRESMFQYTKTLLKKSFNKVYIEIPDCLYYDLREMLKRADLNVIKEIINELRYLNIEQNIEILKNFIQFLKENYPISIFEDNKIIPNQKYELCSSRNLYKDCIKDEKVKEILKKLFNIDLKKELVLDLFSDIINHEKMNFINISNKVNNRLSIAQINEKHLFDFYSIILQYSYYNDDLEEIIDFIRFFFKNHIILHDQNYDESKCWSSTLTKKVIDCIYKDIINYISQFSNLDEISQGDKEILYSKLAVLYNHATNPDDKIYPNCFGQLKSKREIQLIHDAKIDDDLLNQLFEYYLKFKRSDQIKEFILDKSIKIQDNLKNGFTRIDLNLLHDEIISLISQYQEEDKNELIESFLKFIESSKDLELHFNDLIQDKKNQVTPEILANLDIIKEFIENKALFSELKNKLNPDISNSKEKLIQKLFEKTEKMDEIQQEEFYSGLLETLETGYTGEAIVYEDLLKKDKFSKVNWLAKSDVETDEFIELNGKT